MYLAWSDSIRASVIMFTDFVCDLHNSQNRSKELKKAVLEVKKYDSRTSYLI